MGKKENRTTDAARGRVFELTMDNPENQDELNRRLRKPGESRSNPPAKIKGVVQGESTTESVGKKKKTS